MEIYSADGRKIGEVGEKKLDRVKRKLKESGRKAWGFVVENKEILMILVPAAVGGVTAITKVIGKHVNLRKEENLEEKYCYDRSLGHYWALKRELTNTEWLEIDRRRKEGERLSDILSDFKVLR